MAKVLVIGSGGREHALGWSIGQDEEVEKVFYAPGNAGTSLEEKGQNLDFDGAEEKNFEKVCDSIKQYGIDLIVVGPEKPLVWGIVDKLNQRGFNRAFGPTMAAAKLESDKFSSYALMEQLGISQANSIECFTPDQARKAIKKLATEQGVVIKARGLTGGKGVTVCDSREQALEEIAKHAEAYGSYSLIAERLFGQEFSVFGIANGKDVKVLEMAIQDHKRLGTGDVGVNTGGMGAYLPADCAATPEDIQKVREYMAEIVQKIGFSGFLYAGMMKTADGPKVIEWNIRFGDPEAQPAMMILKNGIYQPIKYALEGRLNEINLEFNKGASVCVVMASGGYPGDYKKGFKITGIENAERIPGIKVFHAGTKRDANGDIVTNGGRVLGVTALGENILDAQNRAYAGVCEIDFEKAFYRTDIADKALKRA